jgi:hypothetical protein
MTCTESRKSFRVTSRDREIVGWIGRLRMATASQVAERFNLGRAVSYARLSAPHRKFGVESGGAVKMAGNLSIDVGAQQAAG